MSNFRERPRTLRTGLWDRPIRRAFRNGYKRFLHDPFFGKDDQPKKTCSRFFDLSCSDNIANGFLVGVVLLSRCHGPLCTRGSVLLFLFAVLRRCSVADVALGRTVFECRMLTISEYWLAAQTAPTFISHVSLQV